MSKENEAVYTQTAAGAENDQPKSTEKSAKPMTPSEKRKAIRSSVSAYLIIFFLAVVHAFTYHVFVFKNEFAPAGINGILTMVQYLTDGKFSLSWMGFVINIPLAIATFFIVDKRFGIRSMFFLMVFSFTLELLARIGFYQYAADPGEKLLGAIAGGILSGVTYGYALKVYSTTGGTDFISVIVSHLKPQFSVVWISFAINAFVACASYFVYHDMGAVILCIIYCFMYSKASDIVVKGFDSALKMEIVTDKPDEIIADFIAHSKHGITEIKATGGYSQQGKTLLICVITKRDLPDFKKIVSKYDNTFTYVSSVNEVYGSFIRRKINDQKKRQE